VTRYPPTRPDGDHVRENQVRPAGRDAKRPRVTGSTARYLPSGLVFAPINAGEQAYSLQNAPTKIGYHGLAG
jgi:hypothetical protein